MGKINELAYKIYGLTEKERKIAEKKNNEIKKPMNRFESKYSNSNIRRNRKVKPEMSEAECKLWSELRENQMGASFKRKVAYGPYILDFYSSKAKLVIEVDKKRYDTEKGRQKNTARDEYLQKEGLTVLRFSGPEALANMNGVLQRIWLHTNKIEDEPL